MCGLVCIISKKQYGFMQQDKTIFLQMLISDMFRGLDSTGVFSVNKHGNLKMVKDASSASYFINKKESSTFFNTFTQDYHIVVGHNRKATMGATVSENAHPFIEGNICLVHNGTLQNHHKLADRVVDSNAIAAHINEFGYRSLLKHIEGAYALIWYNAEEKRLYFARNAERPLHLVETDDRIFLASEPKMLDWILDRNNLSKYTIQNVPTDKVFKFNLETRKLEAESKPKKAQPPQVKSYYTTGARNQQQKSRPLSVSGQLALVPSYPEVDTTSTDGYKQGQRISWRVMDYEERSASTKLMGHTTDGVATPCTIFLDNKQWNQSEIDNLLAKEYLTANISAVSQKNGHLHLWLSMIGVETIHTSANHKKITLGQLKEAGGACYTCGINLDTEQDILDSTFSVNHQNEIQHIACQCCNLDLQKWNQYGY